MRGWWLQGQGEASKLKAPKTSGGGRTPVRHTIPLGIVLFLVCFTMPSSSITYDKTSIMNTKQQQQQQRFLAWYLFASIFARVTPTHFKSIGVEQQSGYGMWIIVEVITHPAALSPNGHIHIVTDDTRGFSLITPINHACNQSYNQSSFYYSPCLSVNHTLSLTGFNLWKP